MPSYDDIASLLENPYLVPVAVVAVALLLVFVAASRKRARERLKRAAEIESRLQE